MQRRRYLRKRSLIESQEVFLNHPNIKKFDKIESLDPRNSLGRITAEPVFAKISSPHYHCSAMDGIAVKAEDTYNASSANPVRLSNDRLCKFCYVDTGDPIPLEFNAVIMIEDVREVNDYSVEIVSAVAPWQNIRMAGEDIVATELLLTRGHKIRPIDIAIMLSGGITSVIVKKKPLVTIIPTGDEIIEPGINPTQGTIIDSNSYMLEAMVKEWGGEPKRLAIVEDDYDKIKSAILDAALESDIILTSAGSSAGREDFIPPAIEEIGELLVHGISISPGKPTALGIVNGIPIIGLPGYPVSMAVSAECFLKPLLCKMLNAQVPSPQKIPVSVSKKLASKLGDEEFIRVKLFTRQKDNIIKAIPLEKGASILNSLVRADGILRIPSEVEGITPNETVEVELMKPLDEIQNSVVAIGSHDITLDILADEIKINNPLLNFSSAHVGSIGGLMALKRREAHIAGMHLLDEETGEYNIPYLKRLLPEQKIVLVNLVYRQQGLIVERGNPKGIGSLSDIVMKNLSFCNRQRGSGTRILLDFQLKRLGISPEKINGYDREVYTHMAVASAVATGVASAGLGIYAAAKTLGLDFIPIIEERYDLAIPEELLSLPNIQFILETIRNDSFKSRVQNLEGYDTRDTGKIIAIS
ncbi:MAG: molybdopterin biosynthesis protein [bacterium]